MTPTGAGRARGRGHAERRQGETFTSAQWTFHHYGPWAQEVHQRIEPALVAIDADKQLISAPKYDDDVVRWRKRDDRLYEQLERELGVAPSWRTDLTA